MLPSRLNRTKRYRTGFTLVEMLIVVAIIGILAAVATPSFNDYVKKGRVKHAAEEIYGLALQAKSEGLIRDTDTSMNVDVTAPWCVGFASTVGCACKGTVTCTIDVAGSAVTQVVSGADFSGVSITENFSSGSGTTFDRIHGKTNHAGKISVASGSYQADIVLSTNGRIRLCTPSGQPKILGYDECE